MLRDVFLPLTYGGVLCLPEAADEANGECLFRWIHRERISIIHAVPSLAQDLQMVTERNGRGLGPGSKSASAKLRANLALNRVCGSV